MRTPWSTELVKGTAFDYCARKAYFCRPIEDIVAMLLPCPLSLRNSHAGAVPVRTYNNPQVYRIKVLQIYMPWKNQRRRLFAALEKRNSMTTLDCVR
jgi:hypothetical protein